MSLLAAVCFLAWPCPGARAAAPPYLSPAEYEGVDLDEWALLKLEEPFKAAVVGGGMLVSQNEGFAVSTQAIPLAGPARTRHYFLPQPPYPGIDEEEWRRKRAGLTVTTMSYQFPIRWHATKEAYFIALVSNSGGTDLLNRYGLDDLLAGKARSLFVSSPGPRPRPQFTDQSPAWAARRCGVHSTFDARVYYDYLPDGGTAARQFLLTNTRGSLVPSGDTDLVEAYTLKQSFEEKYKPHWSFRVHRCESKWDRKKGVWVPGRWSKECELPVAFKEHFQALQKGDGWFFLTASGRLFVCKPGPEPGKRMIAHVIGDRKRPVLGTIVAPKEDKTFLFIESEKGPAIFELSDRPRLVVYDPKAAKMPDGDEPLRGIMHKARVLVALGRIKGK
jgi:hypothetical protein